MPSHLRLQTSLDEPVDALAIHQHTSPVSPPPAKKARTAKMSLTQTYYVASTARSKLGREAARADHNLRRLVGHANMLDQLMLELSQAEAEQEAWFNASVRTASHEEPRRVQWVDSIVEEPEEEEDVYEESSDDEDNYDEDSDAEDLETELFNIPLRRIKSPPVSFYAVPLASSDEEEEGEEQEAPHSPPELLYDDASDSEDDLPSSPRNGTAPLLSDKERQAMTTTANFYDAEPERQEQLADLAVAQRQQQQPLIAAC